MGFRSGSILDPFGRITWKPGKYDSKIYKMLSINSLLYPLSEKKYGIGYVSTSKCLLSNYSKVPTPLYQDYCPCFPMSKYPSAQSVCLAIRIY